MGARTPPTERPRRGVLKCEYCGRAMPNAQALRSHQNTLHATALKEKAKRQSLGTKPTKVQKPETRKALVKKVDTRASTKLKDKTPPKEADTPKSVRNTGKTETDTSKSAKNTPKTETITAKEDKESIETEKTRVIIATNGGRKAENKSKPINPKVNKLKTTDIEELAEKQRSKSPKMEAQTKNVNAKSSNVRKVEFKCPICEKLFPVLFSAQKHMQKNHKEELTMSHEPILLELCTRCNKKFSSPHSCPNRSATGVSQAYECIGCEQRFKSIQLFDTHVANIHTDISESLFFRTESDFNTWKAKIENQMDCDYESLVQYNSKTIYRCSNIDEENSDVVRYCPSTIVSTKQTKGFQINFYPIHYGHHCKQYTVAEQYKAYSVTDLIQQAMGDTKGTSSDDGDLYLQFKTLMESIVLDAAKMNINSLKVLIGKALDMSAILTQYDEDEDMGTTVNVSTLSLNVNKKEDQITKALEEKAISLRKRKVVVEDDDEKKPKAKRNTFSLADDKDSDKILKELDGGVNKTKITRRKTPNREEIENVKTLNQSPSSFNDSYKDFIDKTINSNRKTTPAPKKKVVVKTKIGQFKPSLSPKNDVTKRNSIGKAKDIQYEVKERENDCNILILKL